MRDKDKTPQAVDGTASASSATGAVDFQLFDCVVCGKSFSRGHADLFRHQHAPTLKHLTSDKKTTGFSFKCNKGCGLYFSTVEMQKLHEEVYRCEMTPEQKYKEREKEKEKLEKEREKEREKEKEKNKERMQGKEGSVEGGNKNNNNSNINSSADSLSDTGRPKRSSRIAISSEDNNSDSNSTSNVSASPNNSNPRSTVKQKEDRLSTASSISTTTSSSANAGLLSTSSSTPSQGNTLLSGRLKRARILLPQDRMAYFSVISLLSDREMLKAQSEPVTTVNCEGFLTNDGRSIVNKLKQVFMYDV